MITPPTIAPVIYTYTGKRINPLAVRSEDIAIEDIAHSLATVNRFGGHVREPISVAQHSVYAAKLVELESFRDGGRIALQALLHDASEAYLGDVTRWLKLSPEMAAYREAEEKLQRLIYSSFSLPVVDDKAVERADNLLVRYEGRKGFGDNRLVTGCQPTVGDKFPPLTPKEITLLDSLFGGWRFWDWREAESRFLETYTRLRPL